MWFEQDKLIESRSKCISSCSNVIDAKIPKLFLEAIGSTTFSSDLVWTGSELLGRPSYTRTVSGIMMAEVLASTFFTAT